MRTCLASIGSVLAVISGVIVTVFALKSTVLEAAKLKFNDSAGSLFRGAANRVVRIQSHGNWK